MFYKKSHRSQKTASKFQYFVIYCFKLCGQQVTIRHPFYHRTDFARIFGYKDFLRRTDPSGKKFNFTHVDDYTERFVGRPKGLL